MKNMWMRLILMRMTTMRRPSSSPKRSATILAILERKTRISRVTNRMSLSKGSLTIMRSRTVNRLLRTSRREQCRQVDQAWREVKSARSLRESGSYKMASRSSSKADQNSRSLITN